MPFTSNPFGFNDEPRRPSYRSRDGHLKVRNAGLGDKSREHSFADPKASVVSNRQLSSEDEDKPPVYDPEPKTEEEKQMMLKKTKHNR